MPDIIWYTYNLRTWQYACLEDDFLNIFFLFGRTEVWEGDSLCYNNTAYMEDPEI